MRFLISVLDTETGFASLDEMAAIGTFNERLKADGRLVLAAGLVEPGEADVIDARGNAPSIRRGSHAASDEYVSGLWIVDAPSAHEAQAIAVEASRACNRKVELRAFLDV